ncbi:hypothetical protein OHB00_05115 [Streptomyces sp. NBC_00631]|uniref:hypothetical protein n=1 Tax=Streptomyces sp. NBC_00631 TaxID=2975793 RepID=UPI0030E027C8
MLAVDRPRSLTSDRGDDEIRFDLEGARKSAVIATWKEYYRSCPDAGLPAGAPTPGA